MDIEDVDARKYDLEFLRCEVESLDDTEAALGAPGPGGERVPFVVAEFRIANLDDIRRRFDLWATSIDAEGLEVRFTAQDTNRLDPDESSVEQIRRPMRESEVPPFTCSAEVRDSLLDTAFPDD